MVPAARKNRLTHTGQTAKLLCLVACDTCEDNDCHENAKCVSRREDYLCMCKPGYKDVGLVPGFQCDPTQRLASRPPSVPKRTIDNKMCTRTNADIYFLLDLSKTVTKFNLETAIGMIRNMIRLFSYGDDGVKIAIGTFALTFGEVFPFSKYDTRQQGFFMLISVPATRLNVSNIF